MTATEQLVITDNHRARASLVFSDVARVIWMTGDTEQAEAIIARALAVAAVDAADAVAYGSAYCPDCGTWRDQPRHRGDCPYRGDDEIEDDDWTGERTWRVDYEIRTERGEVTLETGTVEVDGSDSAGAHRHAKGAVSRGRNLGPGRYVFIAKARPIPGPHEEGCPEDPDGLHFAGCGCPDVDPVDPN